MPEPKDKKIEVNSLLEDETPVETVDVNSLLDDGDEKKKSSQEPNIKSKSPAESSTSASAPSTSDGFKQGKYDTSQMITTDQLKKSLTLTAPEVSANVKKQQQERLKPEAVKKADQKIKDVDTQIVDVSRSWNEIKKNQEQNIKTLDELQAQIDDPNTPDLVKQQLMPIFNQTIESAQETEKTEKQIRDKAIALQRSKSTLKKVYEVQEDLEMNLNDDFAKATGNFLSHVYNAVPQTISGAGSLLEAGGDVGLIGPPSALYEAVGANPNNKITDIIGQGIQRMGDDLKSETNAKYDDKHYISSTIGDIVGQIAVAAIPGGAVAKAGKAAQMVVGATSATMQMADGVHEKAKEAGLSDEDAGIMTLTIAPISGLLEIWGASNIIDNVAGKKIINELIAESTKKLAGQKVTKELIFETVGDAFKTIGEKYGLNALKSAGEEGATEGLQAEVEKAAENIYDESQDKPKYGTEFFSVKEQLDVAKQAALGAVAGGSLGILSGISSPKNIYDKAVQLKENPDQLAKFRDMLDTEVKAEHISPEQADEIKANINAILDADEKVPPAITDKNKRFEAIELIKEKTALETEIKGMDKAITTPQRDKIKEINSQLEAIATGKEPVKMKRKDLSVKATTTKPVVETTTKETSPLSEVEKSELLELERDNKRIGLEGTELKRYQELKAKVVPDVQAEIKFDGKQTKAEFISEQKSKLMESQDFDESMDKDGVYDRIFGSKYDAGQIREERLEEEQQNEEKDVKPIKEEEYATLADELDQEPELGELNSRAEAIESTAESVGESIRTAVDEGNPLSEAEINRLESEQKELLKDIDHVITTPQRKKKKASRITKLLSEKPSSIREAALHYFIGGGQIRLADAERIKGGNLKNDFGKKNVLLSDKSGPLDIIAKEKLSEILGRELTADEEIDAMEELADIALNKSNKNEQFKEAKSYRETAKEEVDYQQKNASQSTTTDILNKENYDHEIVQDERDASQRIENGETLYVVNEQDEETPILINDITEYREVSQKYPDVYSAIPLIKKRDEKIQDEKPVQDYEGDIPFQKVVSSNKYNKSQKRIAKSITNVVKALGDIAPGLKVVLHDTESSFEKVAYESNKKAGLSEERAKKNVRGNAFYFGKDNVIHINLPLVKSNTLYHEGTHPVLNMVEDLRPGTIDAMFEDLIGIEKKIGMEGHYTEDFASVYGEDSRKMEAVTEFIADVADGKVTIDETNLAKIKRFFAKLLKALGIKVKSFTDENIVSLAKKIQKGFEKGELIDIETNRALRDILQMQIIGEKAKLDKEQKKNLLVAKALKAKGLSDATIFSFTGWEMGADGKWRSDSKGILTIKEGQNPLDVTEQMKALHEGGAKMVYTEKKPLSEIVNSDIFKLYPKSKDIFLSSIYDTTKDYLAYFDPVSKFIVINLYGYELHNKKTGGRTSLQSGLEQGGYEPIETTLIHEIQHFVQKEEGFEGGSNLQVAAEAEIEDVIKYFSGMDKLTPENKRKKAIEIIEATDGSLEVAAQKRYWMTAGEVEARNASLREQIGAAERAETPISKTEDVSRGDQYKSPNSGIQMQSPENTDNIPEEDIIWALKTFKKLGNDFELFKKKLSTTEEGRDLLSKNLFGAMLEYNSSKPQASTTDRLKSLSSSIQKSDFITPELKAKIDENGLRSEVFHHEEARAIADLAIKTLGVDGAVDLAEKRLKGSVRAFVYGAAVDYYAQKEAEATNPMEKDALAQKGADIAEQFQKDAEDYGRFISAIGEYYKNTPLIIAKTETNKLRTQAIAALEKMKSSVKKVKSAEKEMGDAVEVKEPKERTPRKTAGNSSSRAVKRAELLDRWKTLQSSKGGPQKQVTGYSQEQTDILVEMGVIHVADGAWTFPAWYKKMKTDFGISEKTAKEVWEKEQMPAELDASERTLSQMITEDLGNTEEYKKQQEQILNKYFPKKATEIVSKRKEDHEKIIEQYNAGVFGDGKNPEGLEFKKLFFEKLGIVNPDSPEIQAKITEFAEKISSAPDGSIMQREAQEDLLTYIAKIAYRTRMATGAGKLSSIWYANILSSPATHLRNIQYNVITSALSQPFLLAEKAIMKKDFNALPAHLKAILDGFKKGMVESSRVMKTGRSSRFDKVGAMAELERGGKILKKFVLPGRALKASDIFFTDAAYNLKLAELARQLVMKENPSYSEEQIQNAVSELLGNTQERKDAAKVQAEKEMEAYYGADWKTQPGLNNVFKIRQYEIMDASIPETLKEDALKWSKKALLTSRPTGVLGVLADKINGLNEQIYFTKFVMPFVNVPFNLVNAMVERSPLGLIKALRKAEGWGSFKEELTDDEVKELYIKIVNYAIATTLLSVFNGDEEDAPLVITGAQTGDYMDNKGIIRGGGLEPYSVYVKGKKVMSYKTSPWSAALLVPGYIRDAKLYGKASDIKDIAAYAGMNWLMFINDQSAMQGVQGLVSTVAEAEKVTASTVGTTMAKYAQNMILPYSGALKFFNNNVKAIMREDDKRPIDSWEYLTKDVPFIDQVSRARKDHFGQDVKETFEIPLLPVGQKGVFDVLGDVSEYYRLCKDHNYFPSFTTQRKMYVDGTDIQLSKKELDDINTERGQIAAKALDSKNIFVPKDEDEVDEKIADMTTMEYLGTLDNDEFKKRMDLIFTEATKLARIHKYGQKAGITAKDVDKAKKKADEMGGDIEYSKEKANQKLEEEYKEKGTLEIAIDAY